MTLLADETPSRLMPEDWLAGLQTWAEANHNVSELWLFGSRATGVSTEGKWDVALALALMPPTGKHDLAFANFWFLKAKWSQELEVIVGRHVSLEGIRPGTPKDAMVRSTGARLWSRSANSV